MVNRNSTRKKLVLVTNDITQIHSFPAPHHPLNLSDTLTRSCLLNNYVIFFCFFFESKYVENIPTQFFFSTLGFFRNFFYFCQASRPSVMSNPLNHPSITKIGEEYWFHEISKETFPGQAFSLRVSEILYHTKSEFQDILIFKSTDFGNVLVLNGIIQCTEKDEFAYQELITHVPMMAHAAPKRVLVIGGGDCGVLREVVKHEGIESVTMVEIDRMVIELLKKYLPGMAKSHNHPKAKIVIDDGFKFLKNRADMTEDEKFDVIITDLLDPEGPAEEFFRVGYFKLLLSALKKDGIVIMQTLENVWLNLKYVVELKQTCCKVFENVEYCQTYMPSYTSGQLGLLVATHDANVELKKQPLREIPTGLKYYLKEIHSASFVLPAWADSEVNY